MSDLVTFRSSGRRAAVLLVLLLLLALTTLTAVAQSSPDMPTDIPDAELQLEPVIISQPRDGDATTITVEIPVGSDTFTASNRPTTNFSTDSFIRVGFNATNGAQRGFLAFNLSTIPANAFVQSATLRAHVAGFAPANDAPLPILARFLSTAWDPTILTWNNFNPQWGAEIGVGDIPATIGVVQADVTGPVREWVSGTRPNFGLMLQGNESPNPARERIFFAINAQNNLHPRLIVTYQVDTTPPTSIVNPLGQWERATFRVSWSGQDNPGGTGIRHFDVQYRMNGGAWQNWQTATTATSANFTGVNAATYNFRVRATDRAGNAQPFPNNPQATTRVDSVAPNSIVNPLPQFTFTDAFMVTWSGLDPQPGSGVARFEVQFQVNGGGWQTFVTDTTATSARFTNARVGNTYGFRVRALDWVGNVESFSPGAQAQTLISGGDPIAAIVPFPSFITQSTTFVVRWQGTAVPGTQIDFFDVQYRFNGGAWTTWLTSFPDTSASFTAMQGDGVYEFRVRVYDNHGGVSAWAAGPGNGIAVDTVAPFIRPRTWLPVLPAID